MKITRELLESLTFRVFTENDYYGFAGVQSPVPLISDNTNVLVIIDGCYAELYANLNNNGEADDVCDDIRELMYKSPKQIAAEAQIEALERQLAELKSTLAA
jgi:hypothetical protein